ncbi:bifunctional riboflavin kinase/FAD synthetase [Apibacter sp.]|uniref:bifunctional riboflavin kinase/FAD synthetase n=1 Tax=Apibacter sp. TaxID=2023709 RepID=UPI0025EA4D60|nr:bifunctional riboflavin kinase/FAD synthetase [Apibacter sp.]MCT6869453.1 bifunctional riboflavin kinase/FAD synthetase [Apibacter sp.]
MNIHTKNLNISKNHKIILTLGMFDGVHLGHQYVLKYLSDIAKKEEAETAVMTFNPHPRLVLQPFTGFELLTTLEEKIQLLEKFNVQHLFIQEFTKDFSQLSALEFVRDILVARLHIHSLVIGYDHQFGNNRDGNYERLQMFSKQFGFKLYKLPALSGNNSVISSTKIRNKISEGKIIRANEYLGYNFLMKGKVIKGDKIGATLGFPTANIEIDEHKICPKNGVYFVKVKIKENYFYGMMNIGKRPTVNGLNKQIEVHILDFNRDIYGEEIEIYFYDRSRDENKFSSLEELKNRLAIDKENTINYFKKMP